MSVLHRATTFASSVTRTTTAHSKPRVSTPLRPRRLLLLQRLALRVLAAQAVALVVLEVLVVVDGDLGDPVLLEVQAAVVAARLLRLRIWQPLPPKLMQLPV